MLYIRGDAISNPAALPQRLQHDALNLLHNNGISSLIVTLSICVVMVFAFPHHPQKELKIYWFAFFCLIFILRYWDSVLWKKHLNTPHYDLKKALRRFEFTRYLTAFSLGLYSILFMSSMALIELVCTLVIMSAMAGGAITVLAAHRELAYSYAPILLLPASIQCLLSPEDNMNTLGGLGLIFTAVMVSSARSAHKFTLRSIKMKHQNSDLLEQMALKNQEIIETNANLETLVHKRTEKIFELSHVDALTRLSNRHSFTENLKVMIESCQQRGTKLAMLFIDLDGFKNINDSHGHAVGDLLLIETARRLDEQVEAKYLSRWGGDEFLIAIENISVEAAYKFAQHLVEVLSQPIKVEQISLSVGATIGIAMYPDHSTDSIELISLADTAMYIQKQSSKSDVCVFNEPMKSVLHRQIYLQKGLVDALENHEFFVVFQPVVNARDKRVQFCEALLRWQYRGELISPMEFIPVAEKHGLIHQIGDWVLHEACDQVADWPFDNDVSLSVNVSVAQLMRGELIKTVQSALNKSALISSRLHIEITESIFAEDIEFVIKQVRALQALGVKVSIDDFGTGFSSLALLQSLSADTVKIDRRFVQSFDEGGMAIIQATQYIADELGYSVVVEGVENQVQADKLADIGVEYLQGFYFSYPMKADALAAWHQAYTNQLSAHSSSLH